MERKLGENLRRWTTESAIVGAGVVLAALLVFWCLPPGWPSAAGGVVLVSLAAFGLSAYVRWRYLAPLGQLSASLRQATGFIADSASTDAVLEIHMMVDETLLATQTLLGSAAKISSHCSAVADSAKQTAQSSEEVASHLESARSMSEKATRILQSVLVVARRADFLAINAALEGTRAGEAGRGITLVAGEMRRLSEAVTEAAVNVRELIDEMKQTSQGAAEASSSGQSQSVATTQLAEQIATQTRMQQQATEIVMTSMNLMKESLQGQSADKAEAAEVARELDRLAEAWR